MGSSSGDFFLASSGATAGARTAAATKPLTMFYNGGVAVFHLPQDKAEDLLKMAAGEGGGDCRPGPRRPNHGEELLSKMRQEMPIASKRSLQRFFQKRKERPPPYDADPRYARVQREGLVSRREKSINLAQEESVALRRNGSSSGIEHLAAQKKRSSTENEGEYKVHRSESKKSLSAKAYSSSYAVVGSEDEDVCPTCLEEYTPDNPKIITKCCHHFHLGCIYEWMERSDTCPICCKV
ncbi:hypothetical protein C2845_PM14G14160 [Panicum miliaceum]|uniref:RING-type E3 ubiquitin transferase n=1 Tax=Panicum miliaceum TaxID=4540 RepID=A0A3L6PVD9_PANMI|nr:hypothetical protein C2845_PM14G14160 [Panicum miliaceum]